MTQNITIKQTYVVNGEEKTRWVNIGKLFEKDGKQFGKLDVVPLGWDGRFYVFEDKNKNQSNQGNQTQSNYGEDLPY